MTNHDENNDKKSINPVVASLTGVVVGAGLAATGAMVLKDEKNRTRIKKVLADFRDQAMDYKRNFQKDISHTKTEAEKKLTEGELKAENAKEHVSDDVHKVVSQI